MLCGVGLGPPLGIMARRMPKARKTMAVQPMTLLNRPVYTGPGTNFSPPQTRRQKIGVPHATLFAATAREKSAAAAAGAMRQRRPRMRAMKTQPQTARTGIRRRACTWLKKPEKGRAPSRENAYISVNNIDLCCSAVRKGEVTYPTLPANSNQHGQPHEELNDEQQTHQPQRTLLPHRIKVYLCHGLTIGRS
jgi:hypothetical protein